MAYKDKDRQREAVKKATKRYRAKKGDSALSGQKQVSQNARGLPVVDEVSDTPPVIPNKGVTQEGDVTPNIGKPPYYGQPDCECMHCQQNKANGNKHLINHGPHKTADQLGSNEVNRAVINGQPAVYCKAKKG